MSKLVMGFGGQGFRQRSQIRGWIAGALIAASFSSSAAGLADGEFEKAVGLFQNGRASAAFGEFIQLANSGDVDAARIALFMHTYGPLLFGKHWEAGVSDVDTWKELVRRKPKVARPIPEFQPAGLQADIGAKQPVTGESSAKGGKRVASVVLPQ